MYAHINATKLLQTTTITKCTIKRRAVANEALINANPMLKNVEVPLPVANVPNAPCTHHMPSFPTRNAPIKTVRPVCSIRYVISS